MRYEEGNSLLEIIEKKDDVTSRRYAPLVVTNGQYLMEITRDHSVSKETFSINASDAMIDLRLSLSQPLPQPPQPQPIGFFCRYF